MSDKKITKYFMKLIEACQNNHVYSVKAVIAQSGFDVDQVIEWSKSNERWRDMLDWCRMLCESNADRAGMHGILPVKEACRYIYENRYQFADYAGHNTIFRR